MEVTFRTKKPDKKAPKPLTFSWRRPGLLGVLGAGGVGAPGVCHLEVDTEAEDSEAPKKDPTDPVRSRLDALLMCVSTLKDL